MNPKVLIVDDEENIVELLKFNMELKGYDVECAYDGEEGFMKAKASRPSLILLDIMLPKLDGMKFCSRIRKDSSLQDTAIIMLTAKNMEKDKVAGLENGADDYITKPFSINELMARIKAVSRRLGQPMKEKSEERLEIGDIVIDLNTYEVRKRGEKMDLTLKEFELLKLLALNRGKVLHRNDLLDKIWGYEYFGETRTVDVHIRHLRKKIEDNDKLPEYIETVRGVGYKMK